MPIASLEDLLAQHQEEVYRHLLRVCHGRREDAEDALAEAVLNGLKALNTLKSDECFCAWLKVIATRVCLRLSHRSELVSAIRFSCIDDSALLDFEQRSPEQQAEDEELRTQIHCALDHLSEPYRGLYASVEIGGEGLDSAARSQGISYEAAKSRLRRARSMMREHLNNVLGGSCCMGTSPPGA